MAINITQHRARAPPGWKAVFCLLSYSPASGTPLAGCALCHRHEGKAGRYVFKEEKYMQAKKMKKLTTAVIVGALLALVGAGKSFAVSFVNQKVCSAIDPSNFRDTVIAGKDWTAETCQSYAAAIAAPNHQLGCITNDGFVFGAAGDALTLATVPNPNCGW